MSVDYVESIHQTAVSGTGSLLYETAFLGADEIEADQRRTHVVFNCVNDPVLRDALETFHIVLLHHPSNLAAWKYRPFIWAESPSLHSMAVPYWYHTRAAVTYPSVNYVTVTDDISTGLAASISCSITTAGLLSQFTSHAASFASNKQATLTTGRLPVTRGILEALEESSSNTPLAATAVDEIADWLGVPAIQVLKATGIKKRTYQAWKRNNIRRPRLSSQGRLWDLHQLAKDLTETLGSTGVRSWFSQDPQRIRLLRNGALEQLAAEFYASLKGTSKRPQWVDAGSMHSYSIQRRKVAVPPMDFGDIVEGSDGPNR